MPAEGGSPRAASQGNGPDRAASVSTPSSRKSRRSRDCPGSAGRTELAADPRSPRCGRNDVWTHLRCCVVALGPGSGLRAIRDDKRPPCAE